MPALRLSVLPGPWRRNGDFANHARRFANRAVALPGFPMLPVAGAAATVLTVMTGAFGTGAMPIATRTGLWVLLISWNIAKWQIWFALLVRGPADWRRAAALGAVVLNLPLPFEVALVLRLFGVSPTRDVTGVWLQALAISAVIFVVLSAVRRGRRVEALPPAEITPGGLLAKAGIAAPDMVLAIRAEDHYCRLFLAGRRDVLIHHRFGDALAEVAAFDGAQVHRGVWVAAHGITAAARAGRAWRLLLPDGTALPVSARFAADARARGWLARAKAVAIAVPPG